MTLDKNDPRLTAYALGELSEDERVAFENEHKDDPDFQQQVKEIRDLGSHLESHYEAEDELRLTDEQRDEIIQAARKSRKEKIAPFPTRPWKPMMAAAAMFAVLFFMSGMFVVVKVVKDNQVASFCPPPPVMRPKMELKKMRVKAKRSESPRSTRIVSGNSQTLPEVVMPETWGIGSGVADGIAGYELAANPNEKALFGSAKGKDGPSIDVYAEIKENGFERVADEPLSTFSIDVDTASYSQVRNYLSRGMTPPKDAVRVEELINYFRYDYAPPQNDVPFATHLEVAACPWNEDHQLVRIGLKGKVIEQSERPSLNLVFLLDVSGSMEAENKLPLMRRAMSTLVKQLDERDHVSVVVYAGASGLVLPPTSGADSHAILAALNHLQAGGGTNGGEGIDLAYKTAEKQFVKGAVNRVILCTDGDFNIGVTQGGDLNRLIEKKAKRGVFLSVLGFGMGNYKDSTVEQLADRGNGNYAYIDSFSEARKVLVDQMTGTLVTIAKDVKIQVEFNPAQVAGYRLIGYENRMLAAEDFNDDQKDAGEIGAGHTVTAMYEVIPAGQAVNETPLVDALKYQAVAHRTTGSDELLTVKLRYKEPDRDVSRKREFPLMNTNEPFLSASEDFRFAASVAGFGMLLRDSENKGMLTYEDVLEWGGESLGDDEFGYRREFRDMVRNAAALKK